jgi:DNA ligase-1
MQFSELATYFQKLETTPSRNAMTEILATLFGMATAAEIGPICYLLLGRVAPLYEAIEFGVAEKFLIRAIAQAYDVDPETVTKSFKKHGDLGAAAEELYTGKHKKPDVASVFADFLTIANTNGTGSQEKKIELIATLLQNVDRLSARYIARIPLDKLRLGFSDMTMLDALSWMMAGDKSKRDLLEYAYSVRPDIGFIATSVKKHGEKELLKVEAQVGAPILASLCQRLPNADEMIKKMGTVAVEPKYDGVRVQIHIHIRKGKTTVQTYSRNLENTTAMYPELLNAASELDAREVILDCEALVVDPKTGKIGSFQETTTRKRKHGIEQIQETLPLRFFVFDLLYKDGVSHLATPLSKRRELLEKTVKPDTIFAISPKIITDDADAIRAYHDEQIGKGLEGVVVKKWDSPYEPGRRGFAWVKFKEEEGKTGKLTDTIDAVVMGYYLGEGKRSGFGIGAFLVGVRSGKDTFVTLTKIGTGVSDEQWRELKAELQELKSTKMPTQYVEVHKIFVPDVWVSPKLVVEIAGDDLTKSPTHGASYAVRFPRLVRIRRDKGPAQATSKDEVSTMFANQKSHHAHA